MRLRIVVAMTAAVSLSVALAGCQSKVGAAATVGGDRIAESDVAKYLTVNSKPFANGNGQQVVPRAVVLQSLVRDRVFSKTLRTHGGDPSAGDIASATQTLLNGETEAQLTDQITQSGFAASFEPVFLRGEVLLRVLADRLKVTTLAGVSQAIDKDGTTVHSSPRYGPWDSAQLAIGPLQTPNFLSLAPTQAPAASGG